MSETDPRDDDSAIRDLVHRWARAVHAGDLDGVLADHTEDVVVFDVPPPEAGVRGLDAYRVTCGRGGEGGGWGGARGRQSVPGGGGARLPPRSARRQRGAEVSRRPSPARTARSSWRRPAAAGRRSPPACPSRTPWRPASAG